MPLQADEEAERALSAGRIRHAGARLFFGNRKNGIAFLRIGEYNKNCRKAQLENWILWVLRLPEGDPVVTDGMEGGENPSL